MTWPEPPQVLQVRRIERKLCWYRISPRPLQVGHVLGPEPGSDPGALAVLAWLHPRHLDLRVHAEDRVLEADLQVVADVLAALRAIAPPAAAAPPNRSPKPPPKKSPRMSLKSANASGLKPPPPAAPCRPAWPKRS